MSELVAFIGVGNMGCPMAENLMKSGKKIKVFDVSKKIISNGTWLNKSHAGYFDPYNNTLNSLLICFTNW